MQAINILVVDDDPVTRALLLKRLEKADYHIDVAENGVAALDQLSGRRFDVVLTDLMMPCGIDGIGVLEAVKQNHFSTEVILITAHGSIDSAITAMKKGACDYLQKPINFDELLLRLEKIRTLKHLEKNARDLREAMDVTEQVSSQTIQALELSVGNLKSVLKTVQEILVDKGLPCDERIRAALLKMAPK